MRLLAVRRQDYSVQRPRFAPTGIERHQTALVLWIWLIISNRLWTWGLLDEPNMRTRLLGGLFVRKVTPEARVNHGQPLHP